MSCRAILTKVNDVAKTRERLRAWTSKDPNVIIEKVKKGEPQVITTLGCEKCKADLEQDDAAEVIVEKT
jgi:hypothetical protein